MNKKPEFFKIVTVLPADASRKVMSKMMNYGVNTKEIMNRLNHLANKMVKKDSNLSKIVSANRNTVKMDIKK